MYRVLFYEHLYSQQLQKIVNQNIPILDQIYLYLNCVITYKMVVKRY